MTKEKKHAKELGLPFCYAYLCKNADSKIKQALDNCEKQNGIRECKNCGLKE